MCGARFATIFEPVDFGRVLFAFPGVLLHSFRANFVVVYEIFVRRSLDAIKTVNDAKSRWEIQIH